MKEILQYLQNLWNQAGYPEIASYFSAIIALLGDMSFLWKLGTKVWELHQQRRLQRDLHPFYTLMEIQRATQYYVETKCQNVATAKADEPRDSMALAPKENVLYRRQSLPGRSI